jgi:hypothetical protein
MQGNQPRLAEFGTSDRQHRHPEIDILKLEVAYLTEA